MRVYLTVKIPDLVKILVHLVDMRLVLGTPGLKDCLRSYLNTSAVKIMFVVIRND